MKNEKTTKCVSCKHWGYSGTRGKEYCYLHQKNRVAEAKKCKDYEKEIKE